MRKIVMKDGRVRRYRSAGKVAALIREFEGSGLSRAEFGRRRGINYNVLSRWLARAGKPTSAPLFQEVKLPQAAASVVSPHWAAEIVSASGVTLRLGPGAPAEWAARLWELVSR